MAAQRHCTQYIYVHTYAHTVIITIIIKIMTSMSEARIADSLIKVMYISMSSIQFAKGVRVPFSTNALARAMNFHGNL